jgi:predicted transcriptional regulator of viral defense system
LTHATAVYLHGLTDQPPTTIYVNKEQSPKPGTSGVLTQEALDRAFSRNQRTSQYIYRAAGHRYVLLSGKHTNKLNVGSIKGPNGENLSATLLERTLIDIVVRPAYAGGPHEVLAVYEAAKEHLSISKLIATLKKLQYLYPFHQAIGFLLERAGYPKKRVDRFRQMGIEHDFYLTHGLENPEYSPDWRLYYPRGV